MKEAGVARKKSDGRSEQPRGVGEVGDIKPVCTEDCVRITEIKCQPKERRERAESSGVERESISLYRHPGCRLVLLFKSNVAWGVRRTKTRDTPREGEGGG